MVNGVRPLKSQFFEDEFENLEMIILLVANHIYMLIKAIFVISLMCRTYVLCHIDRGSVTSEE